MREDLRDSRSKLHDSLFELYMMGGSDLVKQGLQGVRRDLTIRLEMSALTPEKGEIIRFYAVNRWDEDDEFDEWARPSEQLSQEAEQIVGTTNERLARCRPIKLVLKDFLRFLDD
jgi:DNA polymerase III epsilon subunit-like protein